jgi:lipopolysaccharide transport system ATP-binding protein
MSGGHIALSHVWKKFHYGEVHSRLRDAIPALVGRAFGRKAPAQGLAHDEFWALRDVSFGVEPGQALGLIGPNGAGKSTILKLLTGIMRPNSGRCQLRGRVGALIEVAAGFHPDLTGRENVYLQGVVMGMPRREILRRFDEIVAFAEIDPFIETPVKRYSSGMQARLGFAIAAHLQPEVLLVDEVLSVGDIAFQARAFEKITQLVRQDIPVVIVTHELAAVTALCNRAVLLERGRVTRMGTPQECIEAYLHGKVAAPPPATNDGAIQIQSLRLHTEEVMTGESLRIELDCTIRENAAADTESIGLRVRLAQTGGTVFETGTHQLAAPLPAGGVFRVRFELQMNVQPGVYLVDTHIWDRVLGREAGIGPSRYLEVRGSLFTGYVQLNPQVRIEQPVSDRPPR